MSRVESANNIAIAQPFSPTLFRQGRLRNAELLLEVLRGEVQAEELPERWEAIETQRRQRQGKLADQKFVCGICLQPLPANAYALVQETKQAESIQEWILKPGTSRCCRKCLRGEQRADGGGLEQTYVCKACQKTKAMKFFTKKQVLTLVELDEVQELVCYDCKDVGDYATKAFYCSGCKKKKPFDAFLAVTRKWIQKRNPKDAAAKANGLYCGRCQCPPCVACGTCAAEPVHNSRRQQAYYCDACTRTQKPKQCKLCKATKALELYPQEVRATVAKRGDIRNNRDLCTQCHDETCGPSAWAQKPKQCRLCKAMKPLELYPEEARAADRDKGQVRHNHHLCTQCQDDKKLDEKTLKKCGKCKALKSLNSYPEVTQTQVKKSRKVKHGHHLCTECAKKA